ASARRGNRGWAYPAPENKEYGQRSVGFRANIGSRRGRPRLRALEHRRMGGKMTNRHALLHLTLAVAAATCGLATASRAAELDPAAVAYATPEQFKWRDPTDQIATNQAVLHGDPGKDGLHIVVNRFKPNRLGNPHDHPKD